MQDGVRQQQPAVEEVVKIDDDDVIMVDDDSDGSNPVVDESEHEGSPEMGEDDMQIINECFDQHGSGENNADPMVID